MFLNQPVFQENKICNFKIHLFSFSNTKQTNASISSNKTRENFNLAKIFWNMRVRLEVTNTKSPLPSLTEVTLDFKYILHEHINTS